MNIKLILLGKFDFRRKELQIKDMVTAFDRNFDYFIAIKETAVKKCHETQATENQAAGIEIWEWQGKRSDSKERTEGTMHSKYAVFDNTISLVGSYNLDPRSENLNSESALVFENARLSKTLAKIFIDNDLAFSQRISMLKAKQFLRPTDPVYNLEKSVGDWFKEEL